MIAGAAVATHAVAMPASAFVPAVPPADLSEAGLEFTLPQRRFHFSLPDRSLHFTLVDDDA